MTQNRAKRHDVKRTALLIPILVAMWSGGHAAAQQPTFRDALMDRLVGDWVLSGTINGHATTHDIRAEWVLNHQYVRIHETSRETNAGGEPAYDAFVFIGWNAGIKQYSCAWLDVYGSISAESIAYADPSGDKLAFLFKAPDGDFHTTFAYDEKTNSWEMKMDSEAKGRLEPYARTVLTSKNTATGAPGVHGRQ
jgi:hypothetical protein